MHRNMISYPVLSNFVYLITKRSIFSTAELRKRIFKFPKLICNEVVQHPSKELDAEEERLNILGRKLVYNSVVAQRNKAVRWKVRSVNILRTKQQKEAPAVPVSLKFAYEPSQLNFDEYKAAFPDESPKSCKLNASRLEEGEKSDQVNLPYSIVSEFDFKSDSASAGEINEAPSKKYYVDKDIEPCNSYKQWMSDYEVFEEIDEAEFDSLQSEYGTADPNVFPSNIPCGGCGAHLHCQNISIPGFLPKELFLRCSEKDLKLLVCQRCTFLKHYNVALSVNVDPKSYPQLLSCIKSKRALVLLLVDMLDFPCSIWPNMLDIIGRDTPLVLIGNKIDLLPGDSSGWLYHSKKILLKSFPASANILHVALISAKTGFGVEELITKIQNIWQTKGDIYLIGCTNVGKSSLFNALLQSDLCKSEAMDLIQRATVSQWPGTTLNLLKFPVLRMSAWRSYLRSSRLTQERQLAIAERRLEKMQAHANKTKLRSLPQIIGLIGTTFKDRPDSLSYDDSFSMPKIVPNALKKDDRTVFDPNDSPYKLSKWCYDTPGVVHDDQIINILTTEELTKTLPSKIITPRMFSIYPKQSLMIGGLARIDLVDCDAKMARLIVYVSDMLPITLCPTEHFDEVYNTLLGTKYLGVPCGDRNRLGKWPPLKCVRDFEFTGKGHITCLGDIVLSSAGWISPLAAHNVKFILRPFTPDGRGIHFRGTPLLRYTAKYRKRRVCNTPTYFMSHAFGN